jgi:tetratricopeptide (TPR) repeat protein
VVAVKKKKKHNKHDESAAKALDEIQHKGDDLAEWIGQNPIPILGAGVGILALAAGIGFFISYQDDQRLEASSALAEVRLDYRSSMGALPGDLDIPEPANAETARQTRSEHVALFKAVAEEYDGDIVGSMALLEAGSLEEQLGEREAAIETWQQAVSSLEPDTALRAIVLNRIAGAHEAQGDYAAAAARYAEAAEIHAYPLRYVALVNAARCLAEAGDVEAAVAAYERVEVENPDLRIPAHTAARMRELRAANSL